MTCVTDVEPVLPTDEAGQHDGRPHSAEAGAGTIGGAWLDARLLAGVLFLGFGVVGLLVARQYVPGTPARMGPGFFPLLIAALLTVSGLLLTASSRFGARESVEPVRVRPLLLVLGSIVTFGLAVEPLGLLAATALVVLIGGGAVPDARWRGMLGLAAVLALVAWLLFVVLLGLPLPVVPR